MKHAQTNISETEGLSTNIDVFIWVQSKIKSKIGGGGWIIWPKLPNKTLGKKSATY